MMNNLSGKKILFICPRFFGYELEIERELTQLGATVDFFDERPFNSSIAKILNRLNLKLAINRKIKNYYSSILDSTDKKNYDFLFVISPETMTPEFLIDLRDRQKNIKTILYLWDSIKNKKNAFSLIEHFDKVITFDESDMLLSDRIDFLPLFYINAYDRKGKEKNKFIYNVAFIGTAHSGRYSIVNEIIKQIDDNSDFKNFIFFFSPSKILFLLKKIFTNELDGISFNDISFKSMTSRDMIAILDDTHIIIDIEHPNQNGLTMRTIEMLGMQKKIITTNASVKKYDFYNSQNIYIVDRKKPSIDVGFLQSDYEPVNESIREKYSLPLWLKTLFS